MWVEVGWCELKWVGCVLGWCVSMLFWFVLCSCDDCVCLCLLRSCVSLCIAMCGVGVSCVGVLSVDACWCVLTFFHQ